jgi:hypothetical protein
MNSKQNNKSQDQNTEKLKEIPKWTRKYARNRTLTPYVHILIITLVSMMAVVVPLSLVIVAFEKGNMILACVSIIALAAILTGLIFSVSKYGGKNKGWIYQRINQWIYQRIDQWIYGKEGTASMPEPQLTKKKKRIEFVVGAVGIICIIGTIYFGMEGYISFKYIQPVTAIYFVPFEVYEYFLRRSRFGLLVLICPILYTIHAILIIAGVPIYFTGDSGIIRNMFLPVAGYTFLAHVIAYLYSRYALKKLKGLTHLEGEAANEV